MSFVNLRYGLAACCAIGFAAVLDFLQLSLAIFTSNVCCYHCSCSFLYVLFVKTLSGSGNAPSGSCPWLQFSELAGTYFPWRFRRPWVVLFVEKKSSQALRTLVNFAETQLGNFVSEGWLDSQLCAHPKKGGKLLQQKVFKIW